MVRFEDLLTDKFSKAKHDDLVKALKELISSLDLYHIPLYKSICPGFKPDIIMLVGPRSQDRVYIDVVNDPDSLNRDIGSLLILKANLEHSKIPYRRIIAVYSDKIKQKHLDNVSALIGQTPKFELCLPYLFEETIKELILESANEIVKNYREELDQRK
jgi:hypothetical protein